MDKAHQAAMEALAPLANIADHYDSNDLEDARPSWVESGIQEFSLSREILAGRGGKTLLTLEDAMRARFVLTGKPYTQHDVRDVLEARKVFEALYIGGPTWQNLSDERRSAYIAKVKALR